MRDVSCLAEGTAHRDLDDPASNRSLYHTALGLQVAIEDYIHSEAKFAAIIAVRLGCSALVHAGIVAIGLDPAQVTLGARAQTDGPLVYPAVELAQAHRLREFWLT